MQIGEESWVRRDDVGRQALHGRVERPTRLSAYRNARSRRRSPAPTLRVFFRAKGVDALLFDAQRYRGQWRGRESVDDGSLAVET